MSVPSPEKSKQESRLRRALRWTALGVGVLLAVYVLLKNVRFGAVFENADAPAAEKAVFVDDLSPYRGNWWIPIPVTLRAEIPVDVKLPTFAGDEQRFGELRLGDSEDPVFVFVLDLTGKDAAFSGARLYVDRNKNRDLTDDGPPLAVEPQRGTKVPIFQVPYRDGKSRPYSVNIGVYWLEGERRLQAAYYCKCGWLAKVQLPGESIERAVLLLDSNGDALHGNADDDHYALDLNNDEIPDASKEGGELFLYRDAVIVNDRAYRAAWSLTGDAPVRFVQAPFSTLVGVISSQADGKPLAGGRVEAWSGSRVETASDADGGYSLRVPEGVWTIRVSKPGYIPELRSGLAITPDATQYFSVALEPMPPTHSGTIALRPGESFDFVQQIKGGADDGDFYADDKLEKFSAGNPYQRGLLSLGNIGNIPLRRVEVPDKEFERFGVTIIPGNTYVARLREGVEGATVVLRVKAVTGNKVIFDYYFHNATGPGGG
jgi:hypothetical protein